MLSALRPKTSPSCKKNSRTEYPSVPSFQREKRYESILPPSLFRGLMIKKHQWKKKRKSFACSHFPSSHPSPVVAYTHQSQPLLSRKTANGLSSCRKKRKPRKKKHKDTGRYTAKGRQRQREIGGKGRREPCVLSLHAVVKNNKMCSHSRSLLRGARLFFFLIISEVNAHFHSVLDASIFSLHFISTRIFSSCRLRSTCPYNFCANTWR
jgi:hypothetical protein